MTTLEQKQQAAIFYYAPYYPSKSTVNTFIAGAEWAEAQMRNDLQQALDERDNTRIMVLSLQRERNKAIEELSNFKSQKRWIPVTERLPERGQRCLFVVDHQGDTRHGKVYAGPYTSDPNSPYIEARYVFSTPGCGLSASHWQPSPEPPVQEGGQDA